jgi:carbon monoxide dehydrogenase subunit G
MEFDHSFEVPLPPAEAWTVLMDIERIAPCMPGAELTEVTDPETYKGKVSVRLGPVALTFAGVVKFEEVDARSHTARVKAQGSDSKGRGGANALVDFRVAPAAAGSTVRVHTNLQLSGAVAQYGRGIGMIEATASQLIDQFANNLKARIAASGPPPAVGGAPARSAAPPPAKPIAGFALMIKVFWNALKRLFTGRAST